MSVVATDVGGVSEAVRTGIDGIVVASEDWMAIADAIVDLIKDPVKRHEMGKSARKKHGSWI